VATLRVILLFQEFGSVLCGLFCWPFAIAVE